MFNFENSVRHLSFFIVKGEIYCIVVGNTSR